MSKSQMSNWLKRNTLDLRYSKSFEKIHSILHHLFPDSFVKDFRVQNSMLNFEEQCILLVNKISECAKHSKSSPFLFLHIYYSSKFVECSF